MLASLVPAPVRSIFEKWRADAAAKEQAKADRGKSIVEKLAAGEASTKDLDQAVADGWEPGQLEAAAARLATEWALEKQISSRDEVLARRAKAIADQAEREVKFQAMLSTFRAEAKELKAIEAACDAELAAISTATQQLAKLRREAVAPQAAKIESEIRRLRAEQARESEHVENWRRAKAVAADLEKARAAEAEALQAVESNEQNLRTFRTMPSTDSGQPNAVGSPEQRAHEVAQSPTLRRRLAIRRERRQQLEQSYERLREFLKVEHKHAARDRRIAELQGELQRLLDAPAASPLKVAAGTSRGPAAA